MKKIFITLSLIFILPSCSIDWNGEKDKKIAELEKQVSEQKQYVKSLSFEKQLQCHKLKEEIKNKLITSTAIYKNRDYQHYEELDEIFYSPKLNSCLYSVMTKEVQNGKECNFHKIYNYEQDSSEELGVYIVFEEDTDNCDYILSQEEYKQSLKIFKGE